MAEIIKLKNVSYNYQNNTPFEQVALKDVSVKIEKNDFVALIGHTGSGKSTLVQLINGLLLPTKGEVDVLGQKITQKTKQKELYNLRKKVGIVFQFAESQLFAETVLDDTAFGPLNFGLSKEEAVNKAKEALKKVNVSEELYEKSPFELSGGQMRRVAIAGIIAMNPEILIVDEPTIGLDPKGRHEIMNLFKELNDKGTTIILVTHSMEDTANYANKVIVMEKGQVIKEDKTKNLFKEAKFLLNHHLSLPKAMSFYQKLKEENNKYEDKVILTVDELASEIALKNGGSKNE